MYRITHLLVTATLVLWSQGSAEARSKTKATGPLAPLAKVGRLLHQAGNAALKGKTSVAGGRLTIVVRSRTQGQLNQAGVKSVRLVGFEFELLFRQRGRAMYYLRTFVHPEAHRPSLMSLSGRIPAGYKSYVTGLPLSRFTGIAKPFGTAARRLLGSASTRRCRQLAITSPAAAKRLGIKGRLAKRFLRGVTRARMSRTAACRALAGLRSHTMTIRIDDVAYLARDRRGRPVGLIKGDIRLRGRKLELRLRGFRALRP